MMQPHSRVFVQEVQAFVSPVCRPCSCKNNSCSLPELARQWSVPATWGPQTAQKLASQVLGVTHQPAQPRAPCRRAALPQVGTARKRSVCSGEVFDSIQVSSEASIPAPSSWPASVNFFVRHSGQPWPGHRFAASAECVVACIPVSGLWHRPCSSAGCGRLLEAPVPPTRLRLARSAGAHMLRTLMLSPAVQVRRCSTWR